MVVSSYYHYRRVDGYTADFSTFYWQKGRRIADEVRSYHLLWSNASPRVYVSSYEGLKTDFAGEVKQIGWFLGFELSEQEIEMIQKETSLGRLRERYGEQNVADQFFRKGIVGDWQNHFNLAMLRDIEKVELKGLRKFNPVDKAAARLFRWVADDVKPAVR